MQKVNKALLTQEQAATYDEWARFFASPGWKLYQDFFKPRVARAYMSILNVRGEQELGALQGGLEQLLDLIVRAEDLVGGEYVSQTGEMDEPGETIPATGPSDWQA